MPYTEVSTKVKATDRGLFYAYDSFVPTSYKFKLIKCLIFRVYTIASTYCRFHDDLVRLKNKFKGNGFPTFMIDLCTNSVLSKFYAKSVPEVHTVSKKSIIFVLPFLGTIRDIEGH